MECNQGIWFLPAVEDKLWLDGSLLLDCFLRELTLKDEHFSPSYRRMTVTLNDVSCLLHIRVGGKLLFHYTLTTDQGIKYLVNYLGLD